MKIKLTPKLKIGLLALAVFGLASCRKDDDEPTTIVQPVSAGVYVLNEGGWGAKNSSVSYYEFLSSKTTENIFSDANSGAKLGDTGQDIYIYGSKTYISVNGSNNVVVINTKTAKLIKSITLNAVGAATAFPRYLAASNGKVFVSAFDDNVYVLDTVSLSVQKIIPVGADPEGLAVVGSKLYVANSGGYNDPADSTVSVIDINTLTELKKVKVGLNPNQVVADQYGDIYVTTRGDYEHIKANLYRINTSTDVAIALNIPATGIAIKGDIAYIYKANYSKITQSYDDIGYLTLNVKSEITGGNFIKDGTENSFYTAYGIAIDPVSGDIFIADAGDYQNRGTVYCLGSDGKKKYSFTAGVIPSRFAFYIK